jgi:hypothetical protein
MDAYGSLRYPKEIKTAKIIKYGNLALLKPSYKMKI